MKFFSGYLPSTSTRLLLKLTIVNLLLRKDGGGFVVPINVLIPEIIWYYGMQFSSSGYYQGLAITPEGLSATFG